MRALVGAGVLCVVAACAAPAKSWQPVDVKALQADVAGQRKKNHDRLVLLDEQLVRFDIDGATKKAAATTIEHVRIQGLKPGALQRSVSAVWDQSFVARPTIAGRVLFPDGSEEPLDLEKTWEYPVNDASVLYSNTRALNVPVPVLPAGGVLEYEITRRYTDLKPFLFSQSMGDTDPVKALRFTVVAPTSWNIEWATRSLDGQAKYEPIVDAQPDVTTYRWEANDLAARPRELFGPDIWLEIPMVMVRPTKWQEDGQLQLAFKTAKELSAWTYEQSKGAWAADASMRETVSQVLKGAPDDQREKARRLYDYVCQKVQYCAIEVGYGGWLPHQASAVHANKYGDCKDKANYLKGLLEVAGIKSRHTLVYSHRGHPKPFGLPAIAGNFNHEILTIDLPDGPLLVDPTSRTTAFGDLPASDREAVVLPIEEGGSELGVSPGYRPEEAVEKHALTLSLGADGSGQGTFDIEATGGPGQQLRSAMIRSVPSKRPEVLAEWLQFPGARVSEVSAVTGLELVPTIDVKGRFVAPRVVLGEKDARLIRLSQLLPRWLPQSYQGNDRRSPVVWGWRTSRQGDLTITLPAATVVKKLPPEFTHHSKWFDYRLAYRAEGQQLVAHRELTIKERIIPASEMSALRQAADAIELAEHVPVQLGATP